MEHGATLQSTIPAADGHAVNPANQHLHDVHAHGAPHPMTPPHPAIANHAPGHHGRDKIDWSPEVWHRIDAAVREEIRRSRVVSKFLPTVHIPAKSTTVPSDEVITPGSPYAIAAGEGAGSLPQGALFVDETETTRVNEIWVEFSMTPAQVEEEAASVHGHDQQQHLPPHQSHSPHPEQQAQHTHHHVPHAHHHQMHASTGVSLATRAANVLAQVEDSILCQGENAFLSALIGNQSTTTVGYRFITTDLGLLNLPTTLSQNFPATQSPALPPDQIVIVSPTSTGFYQGQIVSAVAKAFSILQGKGQYGPYALVLHTQPFADANSPLATTLITPAEPIRHLMNAGFFGTGTLPPFIAATTGSNAGGLSGLFGGYGTGGIAGILVTTPGSGYAPASPPSITIAPPSGNNVAQATATLGTGAAVGTVIPQVQITNPGSGYTTAPQVTFQPALGDTTGGGATGIATVQGGAVTGVTVTNAGSKYTAAPIVVFGQATASATVSAAGAIAGVTVTYPGAGYLSVSPPSVTIGGSATLGVVPILYTGFVVSLGGNTMDLVRGKMTADEDVIVRFEQKDANGYYRFRVIERLALRLKDITAVVQLQFLSA